MAKQDFDRVREIREKANEARRLEQRATRRRAVVIQLAVIVGVLVLVGAIIALFLATSKANNPDTPQSLPKAQSAVSLEGVDDIPLSVAGTAVTFGQADAPVTLDVYEDYSCPHCADYEAQVGPVINKMIADGDVIVNYHPIRFVSDYGMNAGAAAACVAVEDPQSWGAVHSALFENYSETTVGWKARQFVDYLKVFGVTDEGTLDCVSSQKYKDWILSNTKTAQDDGVTSTPSLFINGEPSELLVGQGLIDAVEAAQKG